MVATAAPCTASAAAAIASSRGRRDAATIAAPHTAHAIAHSGNRGEACAVSQVGSDTASHATSPASSKLGCGRTRTNGRNRQRGHDPMRIVVNGQQAFGADVLKALLERGEDVVAVYCAPDKEGRPPDPLAEARLAYRTRCLGENLGSRAPEGFLSAVTAMLDHKAARSRQVARP